MLISIIVPVYNTQKYLSECLNSILNQTYQNIELILIDDGSKDESLRICKEYAKKDRRIILIQSEHMGLVTARRLGIKKATGKYCIFVDSDDWIAENLLESIIPLTDKENIDIVNYNMETVYADKSVVRNFTYTIADGVYNSQQLDDIYKKMMFDFEKGCPGIIQSLATKLIKREILLSALETIDNRISMGEDAAVTYKAMLMARKIVITSNIYYFYRVHSTSMTHTKDSDIFLKIYYFQQYMQKVFAGYSKEYRLDKQLQMYLIHFIEKALKDNFLLRIRNSYHMPYQQLLNNKEQKIILYGAGDVGKSYYRQLINIKDIDLVAWIDRGLHGQFVYGYKINSIDILNSVVFDKIIIAVKYQNIAMEIKEQLEENYPGHQIVWIPPEINWWEREIDI